jgi:hypothetical protein
MADDLPRRGEPPLSAMTRREQLQQIARLFDHFVDKQQDRGRHFQPQCLRCLEIQDSLNFVAWITGNSAGLSPFRTRAV